MDHAAASDGGARDFGAWPLRKVSMTIMALPHFGQVSGAMCSLGSSVAVS